MYPEPQQQKPGILERITGILVLVALLATANIDTMWLAVVKNRAEPGFSAGAMAAWSRLVVAKNNVAVARRNGLVVMMN